jgi:hypothetical protein
LVFGVWCLAFGVESPIETKSNQASRI